MRAALVCVGMGTAAAGATPVDPLPSWNEGDAKTAILQFVSRVTAQGGRDFVPQDERIAVFDNDGTLWSEQPYYFQLAFALDRLGKIAAEKPELARTEPFKTALSGDRAAMAKLDQHDLLKIVAATHAGMSVAQFEREVRDWIGTARHAPSGRRYAEMVFQPMLELLVYLRSKDFKTYIVSGGGIDFMRPWTQAVYGIPPEQVIGSSVKTRFVSDPDGVRLEKLPEIDFIDDGPGKPVGIQRHIGRRPIFAAGNSDGDLQMLQWTTAGRPATFAMIVHHTDAGREWAYDRKSSVGRLDKALDLAPVQGWTLVDMKKDWAVVYPSPQASRNLVVPDEERKQ